MDAANAEDAEIRLLQADEVARLISLVRRYYGDSYIDPTQYDEVSVRRAIVEGLRHSIVGFSSAGSVIAHMSLTLRRVGDLTADAGMTLVDPGFRGRKLTARVGVALWRHAIDIGLVGAHDYPVTVHGATQRLAVDQGVYTGMMLDNVPADVTFRGMEDVSAPARSASLIRYLPFASAPEREVFLPPRYSTFHSRILARRSLWKRRGRWVSSTRVCCPSIVTAMCCACSGSGAPSARPRYLFSRHPQAGQSQNSS